MLRTMALTGFIESLSKGIRERSTDFRWRELAEQPLPVPPAHEQKLISSYVDRETARIDALIKTKSRFIDLSREKAIAGIIAGDSASGLVANRSVLSLAAAKCISGKPDVGLLSVYLDAGSFHMPKEVVSFTSRRRASTNISSWNPATSS